MRVNDTPLFSTTRHHDFLQSIVTHLQKAFRGHAKGNRPKQNEGMRQFDYDRIKIILSVLVGGHQDRNFSFFEICLSEQMLNQIR